MKTSTFSLIFLSLLAVSLPLLMTSSCGRAPIESLEEPGGTINVTGAFSDWTPSTSSFAGGVFLLLDPNTNEVFKSDIIDSGKPVFKIENVPVTGKYYGILLDGRFEPRAYLEKTGSDSKKQRVFKLGSTDGNFGTLVVRDSKLESSQQASLEFQANYGTFSVGKPFELGFTTAFVANPDIDGDGIPNILDIDLDGDGNPNISDAITYNGSKELPDSAIASQFNYGYGITKQGFFKCNFKKIQSLITLNNTKTMVQEYTCLLKLSSGVVDQVELTTQSSFFSPDFDKKMKDDGEYPMSRDLIAKDGIWTAQFNTPQNIVSYKEQTILATATLNNGSKKTFITTLEPDLVLTSESLGGSLFRGITLTAATPVSKDFQISFAPEGSPPLNPDKFQVTATLYSAGSTSELPQRINQKDSAEVVREFKFKFVSAANKFETDFDVSPGKDLNFDPAAFPEYRLRLKFTAPASLPGLLGSEFEFFSNTLVISN